MKPVTLPVALLVCWLATLIVGANIAAIHADLITPATAMGELAAITAAAAAAAASYLRGLYAMPPTPPGTEFRLVRSLTPPPSQSTLEGRDALPRPPMPSFEDISQKDPQQ